MVGIEEEDMVEEVTTTEAATEAAAVVDLAMVIAIGEKSKTLASLPRFVLPPPALCFACSALLPCCLEPCYYTAGCNIHGVTWLVLQRMVL